MSTAIRRERDVAPPFVDGERLSGDEFLRRYEAHPDIKHVQLIEGVVRVISPSNQHGLAHRMAAAWLGDYADETPGVGALLCVTVKLDAKEIYEPDVELCIAEELGGRNRAVGGHTVGAPELALEVSHTTDRYDLGPKLRGYERHGVDEYVVWRTDAGLLDWFVRDVGKLRRLEPGADGILRSIRFPGLWLDPVALLANDRKRVKAVLAEGLRSDAHADFVQRLAAGEFKRP
ncbi:MAG TPA: Uma2 family endonuclease [Planctomycetia bacterium]|nr:Uma2 family endonuclease [Planctomycetia bacterium]